jgi:hypothetical protein
MSKIAMSLNPTGTYVPKLRYRALAKESFKSSNHPSPSKYAKSSSNHPSPSNPSLPSVTSCTKRERKGLQRQALGLGKLVSHLLGILKCLQRQHPSSKRSKGEGPLHPTYGLPSPSEGPSDLVPPRSSFHLSRTCKDKQVHPPRVHKSQYHAK